MNKNKITSDSKTTTWVFRKRWGILFGLSLIFLFPRALVAQSDPGTQGYDYDGNAIVAVLPFIGEGDVVEVFNSAVIAAVSNQPKYVYRSISTGIVEDAGLRIPTDMPPTRDLAFGARYALTGGVYPGNYEGEYYLQLWLWDMISSTMIYTDDLVYQELDEGLEALPGLVEWLFSHIVEVVKEAEPVIEETWEDKLVTAGVRLGLSQRWYTESGKFAPGAHALNSSGGIFATVRVHSLFSLQTEINFTVDNIVYRGVTVTGGAGTPIPLENVKYTTYSLMLPLLFKADFKIGDFRIAPLAGIYVFFPLGKVSYREQSSGREDSFFQSVSAPVGYTLGFEIARPCGPGLLLANIRYEGDFGTQTIDDGSDLSYKRRMVSFSVGYALGFITKK
jgi:hypothetical protein